VHGEIDVLEKILPVGGSTDRHVLGVRLVVLLDEVLHIHRTGRVDEDCLGIALPDGVRALVSGARPGGHCPQLLEIYRLRAHPRWQWLERTRRKTPNAGQ
jgi:hypothetical protein